MALFTARARPPMTRLSASSISSLRKKKQQMYMYLYMLAVTLLIIVSVSIMQLGLGSSSAHTAHDARYTRKGASGAEYLRVNRHKGEFGPAFRPEGFKDTEKLSRRKRAEMFDSGNSSKDWKARSADKRGVRNGRTEEHEEVGSKEKEVQYFSDSEGREIDLNDMDDLEEQGYTGTPRMYQGQQLDDMDKFERNEVKEDADKHQGQLFVDMDKFDNRQSTENTNRYMFRDDAVPKFVEESSRNRKYQVVGKNRAESPVKESSFMSENETRAPLQDGKKESRKLGYMGNNGRDVVNKEREDEEQEDSDKLGRSIGDPLNSEDEVQLAIMQTREAPEGSVRAAKEQEIEKRTGIFTRTGDSLRLSLGETTSNPASSHVKNNPEKTNHEETTETGMPPLRGFKGFYDNMKVSDDNDDEPIDKIVVQKNVKSEDAVILDKDSSHAQRLRRDIQVDSLNFPNLKEKKGDAEQSSRSVRETAVINNPDYMKLNGLAMEGRISTSTRLDYDVNPKLNVEVSKSQERFESADVLQTDKLLIKEDQLDNFEDIRDKSKKEMESRNAEEDDSAMKENVVEEKLESRETNAKDSAVKKNKGNDHDDSIQWGFYPTLSKTLKFSKFLSAFFKSESCFLRIFMAWTTAPWAYTPRHQRAIESILHFHPRACIVVFTETVDFQFFDSWVKEGYKIAVARPNLEELLGKTPAIDFAYVWYEWRNMNLFYIHYTELLRIAALHKYGGVWLDMDMILARPLPKLHNVLGSTIAENGQWVLNGAFMSFDKSSPFLKACIEEFVATYDETSLGWNGADLLNRVASNATQKGGKVWLEQLEHLLVLEPIAFFPLSRHDIIKYFSAPQNNQERVEQKKMLSAILDESHATHLWNSVTGHLVPEVGSLVEILLNQFCMRCTDIL